MPVSLLGAFVACDTIRSGITSAATNHGVYLPPATTACLAETCKLAVALCLHYRWYKSQSCSTTPKSWIRALVPFSTKDGEMHIATCLSTGLPAALYLLNNVLYLISFRFVSPAALAIALQTKLPLTAILHYVVMKRARCREAWISLAILSLTILTLHVPWTDFSFTMLSLQEVIGTARERMLDHGLMHWLGPLLGFVIAGLSSITGITTELLLKQPVPFWTLQVWLYLWGTALSAVLVLAGVDGPAPNQDQMATHRVQIVGAFAVVLSTAASGLIVANILRKSDNLVKIVGSSTVMVATVLMQPLLDRRLLGETISPRTLGAVLIIGISTYAFNYYKDLPSGFVSEISLPLHTPALQEERFKWGGSTSPDTSVEMTEVPFLYNSANGLVDGAGHHWKTKP